MKNFFENKGQSLFEVVVAVAISALIITGIVATATNSIQNSTFSRDKTLAASHIQQIHEWLRKERDTNSVVFIAKTAIPNWCFVSLSWEPPTLPKVCGTSEYITGTKFIRQSTFNVSILNGKNLVRVDTTVSWSDAKGLHQITGSTDLASN